MEDLYEEVAQCRWCKTELRGAPWSNGGSAFHPVTGEMARSCYYGGWVCSKHCDYQACLELEESMPGHYGQKSLHITSESYKTVQRNWS